MCLGLTRTAPASSGMREHQEQEEEEEQLLLLQEEEEEEEGVFRKLKPKQPGAA